MMNTRGIARRVLWLAGALIAIAPALRAQDTGTRFMFGGDVGININFFSSARMLDVNSDLPDFERDFLGHGSGMTVTGALVCSIPMSGHNSLALSAQIEDCHVMRHELVNIPCVIHNQITHTGDTVIALTEQEYDLHLTSLYLGGAYQYQASNIVGSAGPAVGTYLRNAYHFKSRVITPDSCFYEFFAQRKRSVVKESIVGPLNLRLPITVRLGILVPVTHNVYFNPAIGLNMDLIPISGSGATITSIQPTMGVRFAP